MTPETPETRNALILITIAEGNPTEIQNNPEVIKAYLGVDANYAYVLETGKVALQGTGEELLQDEGVKKAYLGE